jgi:Spy/CpxP family protein refolding chaperone
MTATTAFSRRLWAFALAAAMGLALPGLAHARGPDHDPQKRAVIEQRLKQLRHDMLRKEVGLDEKKATVVERVLDKYMAEKRKLREQAVTHRRALRQLLESDSNDQQAYTTAIRGLRDAEKQKQSLKERELDELGKLLTAKQQAKLMRATHRLKRQLALKLREHRRGGDFD